MNNSHLSPIILNLQSRLSNDDREHFDLYMKNDVPRRAGDDLTLSGNLKLIQSSFDQDKINEQGFTLLIDAFKQIQCSDAVSLLKEHQRRMVSGGLKESTEGLASIMPPNMDHSECTNIYEDADPYVTVNLLESRTDYRSTPINHSTKDKKVKIIKKEAKKASSPPKPCFCMPLFKNKYFVLLLVLFILISILATLIALLFVRNARINNRLLTKTADFEALNKTFSEYQTERKTQLIIAGQKFGSDGGDDFDDSSSATFTYSHYLSGFIFSRAFDFDACQLQYTSAHKNQSQILSDVHGNSGNNIFSPDAYYLEANERIEGVKVKLYKVELTPNGKTAKIIRGLQFITTQNRTIPPDGILTGDQVKSESFPGYTLGYATGRSDKQIHQLQFFWYQTKE